MFFQPWVFTLSHLEQISKKLIIEAPDNSKDNFYVHDIKFNGKSLTRNYIKHNELQSGGELTFKMQDTPDKNRGTSEDAFPFSMSSKE
jgi:putative alpha-1,2-mannosidase